MLFDFALVSSFLLPSAVLADRLHSEGRWPRSVKRVEQSTDAVSDEGEYSANWAGAVWEGSDGTFDAVTGTFAVPAPSGTIGSGAAAFVGIDGYSCPGGLLQTGVIFTVTNDGATYHGWYEWYPEPMHYYSDFDVSAGDVIRAYVIAFSSTSGIVTIENFTNGQTGTVSLNSTHALCGQSAEWIIEDFAAANGFVPFADFGTVTFTTAVATGPGSVPHTPEKATIYNINQNDRALTSVSTTDSSVLINYLQAQ